MKFPYPLGKKDFLFTTKELMISFAEVGGRKWVKLEGETKLFMKGFIFVVEPMVHVVHGIGSRGVYGCVDEYSVERWN